MPDKDQPMDKDRLLGAPQIRLLGSVNEAMYGEFRDRLAAAPTEGPLVVAITTLGGDPETARAMADDVRLLREAGRDLAFLGKAAVYSAGATFMAGFPIARRFLTRGTRLLLHERQISRTITLSGPLKTNIAVLRAALNEIEHSRRIEEDGFRMIVEGSDVAFAELCEKAPENWYMPAEDAVERRLVAGIV